MRCLVRLLRKSNHLDQNSIVQRNQSIFQLLPPDLMELANHISQAHPRYLEAAPTSKRATGQVGDRSAQVTFQISFALLIPIALLCWWIPIWKVI
jgi:hypothetical protein